MTQFLNSLAAAQRALQSNDTRLDVLIKKYGACQIVPHRDYYGELLSAIIGQQLSEKAGATILKRFLELFGGKMPLPQAIIQRPADDIRAIGVSYPKIGYMKDLAQHVVDDRLDLAHIATLPNETVIEQLVAVKGIGEWSAHMFMIFCLGRLDVLPVGDLGIRKAMMLLYNLPALPDPLTMRNLAKSNKWSPYESVASWYLWESLDNK